MALIVGVIGHRPQKIDNWDAKAFSRLADLAAAAFLKWGATRVLTGMARGWDQACAQAAAESGIPFVAVIPFEGQDSNWSKRDKEQYADLRRYAADEVILGTRDKPSRAMMDRNIYIADHCQVLAALHNGSGGGTQNTLDYAHRIDRRIVNLWASWVKYR